MSAQLRHRSIKPYLASACALTWLLVSAVVSAPAGGSTGTAHRSHAGLARVAGYSSLREPHTLIDGNSKTDCVYAADDISTLQRFERIVSRDFNCVLVYNNSSPSWAGWEDPWFLTDRDPRYEWAKWATAPGTSRQLIITNNLFPGELDGSDWLEAGASGAYEDHARSLARNLVAAGLGDAVIRLADEANATAEPDALGTTKRSLKLWVAFWRRTALAMRSVPGAHFQFDWCVNAYWRPIPLNTWYPGNDVVNIIGIDAYDGGVPVGQSRWTRLYNQADGIREVLRFAAAHGKPVSIPEWGLLRPGPATLGGGADPAYIDDIAGVVRNNPVAYQSYFYNHESANLLTSSPAALTAYIQDFAGGAWARTNGRSNPR
jgi:hypothetical protein